MYICNADLITRFTSFHTMRTKMSRPDSDLPKKNKISSPKRIEASCLCSASRYGWKPAPLLLQSTHHFTLTPRIITVE